MAGSILCEAREHSYSVNLNWHKVPWYKKDRPGPVRFLPLVAWTTFPALIALYFQSRSEQAVELWRSEEVQNKLPVARDPSRLSASWRLQWDLSELSNAYISVVKKFIQFWGKNNAKIKHLEHLQKSYKCLKHYFKTSVKVLLSFCNKEDIYTSILNFKLWMFY